MANNCKNTTTHIDECEHAFIKNGHVDNIFVFSEDDHGSELINLIKTERGYDEVVCLCDYGSKVSRHSSWDGTTFTEPTFDYLYSIGVSNENQAMVDARIAAAEEERAKQAEADSAAAAKKAAQEAVLAKLGLTADQVRLLIE